MFVNKDANMHAQYLEARLIDEAYLANRFVMENGKMQQIPVLSRSDRAAIEEIIPDIRLIIGVLGHLIFEPVETPTLSTHQPYVVTQNSLVGRVFTFSGPHHDARAQYRDEGWEYPSNVPGSRYENMPTGAEQRALAMRGEWINRHLGSVAQTFSKLLVTSADVTGLLRKIEADQTLVHAAYYTDDECIARIAD